MRKRTHRIASPIYRNFSERKDEKRTEAKKQMEQQRKKKKIVWRKSQLNDVNMDQINAVITFLSNFTHLGI